MGRDTIPNVIQTMKKLLIYTTNVSTINYLMLFVVSLNAWWHHRSDTANRRLTDLLLCVAIYKCALCIQWIVLFIYEMSLIRTTTLIERQKRGDV